MALKPKLVVVGAVVSHQVKYFSWTALPYFKSILSEFINIFFISFEVKLFTFGTIKSIYKSLKHEIND